MEFREQGVNRGDGVGTLLFEFSDELLRVGRKPQHVMNDAQHREFVSQCGAELRLPHGNLPR